MAEETQEKAASSDAKPEGPKATAKSGAKEGTKAGAKDEAKSARPAIGAQPLILAGAIVAALAAGTVAGLLLLGPRLAAMRHAAPAAAHAESTAEGEAEGEGKHAKEKGKGGHGKEAEKAVVYRLDNLIVNPAGSQGTRFLMASVAVEVPDARIEARLRERDFQVRDAVIAVLERQPLEVITSPGGRDSVKARLAETLRPMVGRGVPLQIYLPQFVIQ